jgi:hypothetical protein
MRFGDVGAARTRNARTSPDRGRRGRRGTEHSRVRQSCRPVGVPEPWRPPPQPSRSHDRRRRDDSRLAAMTRSGVSARRRGHWIESTVGYPGARSPSNPTRVAATCPDGLPDGRAEQSAGSHEPFGRRQPAWRQPRFDRDLHGPPVGRAARAVRCVRRVSGPYWWRWRVYRLDFPEAGDDPEVAVYCQSCADRRFGLPRRRPLVDRRRVPRPS